MSRKSKVSPFDELFKTNPYLLSEKFAEADALTNCADCVDSHTREVHEEHCDCTDKSDDSDSSVPSACGKKHGSKVIKLKDEQLNLQC